MNARIWKSVKCTKAVTLFGASIQVIMLQSILVLTTKAASRQGVCREDILTLDILLTMPCSNEDSSHVHPTLGLTSPTHNAEPWRPKEAGSTWKPAKSKSNSSRLTVPIFLCIFISLIPLVFGNLSLNPVNLDVATRTLPTNTATSLAGPDSNAPLESTTNQEYSDLDMSNKKGGGGHGLAGGEGRGGGGHHGTKPGAGSPGANHKSQGGKLQVPRPVRGLPQLVTPGILNR